MDQLNLAIIIIVTIGSGMFFGILGFWIEKQLRFSRKYDIQTIADNAIEDWFLRYKNNPMMEKGFPVQIEPAVILLSCLADKSYQSNLPDISPAKTRRYYCGMWITAMSQYNKGGVRKRTAITKLAIDRLQGMTGLPIIPQTGSTEFGLFRGE